MKNSLPVRHNGQFVWLIAFALLLTGCSTHLKFLMIDADTGSPVKNVAVTHIYRAAWYAPFVIIPVIAGGHLHTNQYQASNERGVLNLWFWGQRTRTFEFVAHGYHRTNILAESEVTTGEGCLFWNPALTETRALEAFGHFPFPKAAIAGPTTLTNGFILVPLIPESR